VALLQAGVDLDTAASVAPRSGFGLGGLLIGIGAFFGLGRNLPSRTARVGAAMSGVTLLLTGLGLTIGTYFGFLLGYFGLLFLHPISLLLLGFGLLRSGGLARWARAVPLVMLAVAALTYGFHALFPQVWDPPDALLFTVVGVGWLLLGLAAIRGEETPVPAV